MKRITACFLLCVLLLAGCTGKSDSGEHRDPSETGDLGEPVTSLVQLKNYDAGGIYELEVTLNSYYKRICYTDFQTATKRALCNVDGCHHEDPVICQALDGNIDRIFVMGDHLVWMKTIGWPRYEGYYNGQKAYINGRKAYIGISDRDGKNKKILLEYDVPSISDPFYVRFSGEVFFDGSNLYAIVEDIEGETIQKRVVTIELETGTVTKRDLPAELCGEWVWYLGITGNRIVYNGTDESIPSNTLSYFAYSLFDGSIENLRNDVVSGHQTPPIVDGKLILQTQWEFKVFDLETNTTVITAAVPEEIQATDYYFFSHCIWDGKFFFFAQNSWEPGKRDYYVFDLQTGSFTEITLSWFSYDKGLSAVQVVAESETEFYVIAGGEVKEEIGFGNNYEPYNNTREYFIYAMITKADYYNNIPNFRYITTG